MAKTAPEKTPVTMSDGRVSHFTGKRVLNKAATIGDGGVTVVLDWLNGETRTVTLRPDMLLQYAAHGALQKLGDESSGVEDLEDKIEVTDQLIQRLNDGQWTVPSEGGTGMAGASILARALVKVTEQPIDVVRAYLNNQTNKVKLALRADPAVAAEIQRLEAEKAARAAARGKAAGPSVDVAGALAALKAGAAT